MTLIAVSSGSNINRESNIRTSVNEIRARYPRAIFSSVFKSEAVGFKGPYFLNLAATYQSDLGIEDVLSELHRIEDRLGRERSKDEMSSRTIDLDLLLYGDGIFYDDGFDVPRKEILDSAHVLKPLSDILPHMVHPVIGETLGTLWDKTPAPKKALLTEAPLTL